MKLFARVALVLTSVSTVVPAVAQAAAFTQVNFGDQKPEDSVPFTMTQVATFNLPWRIAFLPDGRMQIGRASCRERVCSVG
jgi:hypothetical protein